MINEDSNIQYLKGVGEKRAEALAKLGIFTVGDLLRYYPRTYRNLSKIKNISDTVLDEECCVKAIVDKKPVGAKNRKGLTLFKTRVTDGTGVLNITIFNNKFAAQSLNEGEEYIFYGKIGGNFTKKEMSSPEILKANGNKIIHPVYPQSQSINSKYIEKLVKSVFEINPKPCSDSVPLDIREKLCLPEINGSLKELHFPTNEDYFAEAKRRLVFEELFILQTGLLSLKGIKKAESKVIIDDFSEDFYATLPFKPTKAQSRAVNDCLKQMNSGFVMNRLLQGDVGSGKTMVAAALIHSAIKSGFQCAFMAPTEILANQHFATVKKFFESTDFNIQLLTGSTTAKNKREIKAKLQTGEIDILIGTHALIQDDVIFKNLGLVITDEQHRFGVNQRNALTGKGDDIPHTLVMSATPIPRTLALMIYGDLDISILDELPPGRQPIETYAVDSTKRERAYNYVKKHLDEGRQGYIVCPLVEESDVIQLASAEEFAKKLSETTFKDYNVGIVHGKMKPKDKDKVMQDFVSGKIQLLVSTTVIEVGVDVPNAVIMIIENAERFGLSQLHQLRGRIGRGKYKSTCILISDAENDTAISRLKIMAKTSDGFKIADEDLKLRGPGDFFGNRQHGLPEMKIAMLTDTFTLNEANTFAKEVLKNDPDLIKPENANLKKAVGNLFNKNKILN
ncbi:MAG: ATP-dependent DNA helicase RecG [Clostridia bacterium]|nr:ATP-dependent DNA helicase RecG [Clostridia bacterium]